MGFRLQASGFQTLMNDWWEAPDKDSSGICQYVGWPAEQGCWQQLYKASDALIEKGDEGWVVGQAERAPKFIHHTTSVVSTEVRARRANEQAVQTLADLVHALLSGTVL